MQETAGMVGFAITIMVLSFTLFIFITYYIGYSRGVDSVDPPEVVELEDSTPIEYQQLEEVVADDETIKTIAYLEPLTGPIEISPATLLEFEPEKLEQLQEVTEQVEKLQLALRRQVAQTVIKDQLRQKYFELWRNDRESLKAFLSGDDSKLPAYWKQWIRTHNEFKAARHAKIDEKPIRPSSSKPRSTNTRLASHSSGVISKRANRS